MKQVGKYNTQGSLIYIFLFIYIFFYALCSALCIHTYIYIKYLLFILTIKINKILIELFTELFLIYFFNYFFNWKIIILLKNINKFILRIFAMRLFFFVTLINNVLIIIWILSLETIAVLADVVFCILECFN